jgi:hypothetical protein
MLWRCGMPTLRSRLLLLLPLVCAIALVAPAGSAEATPPTTETFHQEGSFDIDCGTFVLHEEFVFDSRDTTFYDAQGNPVRLQVHGTFVGTITAPNGQVIRDPGHFMVDIDLTDGTERQVGLIFNIVVPGHGSVAQDVGVIIFEPDGDIVIKGPHEVFEQGVEPLLCPLFE